MRKGDEKRQEILSTAERLFCSRGYEATSVQDILNVMHASKGGFYHHFTSKDEVLKTLCAQRAVRAAEFTRDFLEKTSAQGVARIDAVLYGFMPLRRDETPFVRMLLPLIEAPEGRSMAMIYQDALSEAFLPLLQQEIAAAGEAVCPPVREMEAVILHLVNRCWMDVVALALRTAREGQRCDASLLLPLLERYRRAVEVLLDAPYGSISIVHIAEWDEVVQRMLTAL